ncbi:lysoplasmalogenase [uncultured Microbulbifer sp.]|uniref:lysoplasmalogenase n=1 Tax=uncultured Microbulbifer sp. TaxID=348147 RepID=UPI0025F01F29|nr:lysoplasmalogenase [uncultured Microbulbifer sp.]
MTTSATAAMDAEAPASTQNLKRPMIALALAAAVYMLLDGLSVDGNWMAALKIVPIGILAWQAGRHLAGTSRTLVLLALGFSAIGDVLLAVEFANHFIFGLGAFLLAQLTYAGNFLRAARRPSLCVAGRVFSILVAATLLAQQILPAAGALALPVTFYFVAIVTMALSAALHRSGSSLLFAGALTFMASDALIAINRFLDPVPLAGTWIMLTYYGAQALLVYGLIRADLAEKSA